MIRISKMIGCSKIYGQVALPVILVISGVIIEIAIAFGLLGYFLSTSGLGERLAVRAESAALSGLRNVMIKISRNRDFYNTLCPIETAEQITINGDTIIVKICRTDVQSDWIFSVNAQGIAGTRQKKFQGTIVVDKFTGILKLQSIIEVPAT